jgi:hypothetical protein
MRKAFISTRTRGGLPVEETSLDLERLARVELTSEDPGHPIESALVPGRGEGWRAAGPGPQRVRILFDEPRPIRRVHLVFEEADVERTQEFALSWTAAGEEAGRFLVRQQYTFSPGGSTREVEDYAFELEGVSAIELEIVPDLGGGPSRASMVSLRVS